MVVVAGDSTTLRAVKSFHNLPGFLSHRIKCRRQYSVLAEGDNVILHPVSESAENPFLISKLRKDAVTCLKVGRKSRHVEHNDILGKGHRSLVYLSDPKSTRKKFREAYRISSPTLADYVSFTPRIVTPIYPADANLIVSLLDINISPSSATSSSRDLEILEAGTGHGALTLYLARAIQAANIGVPLPEKNPGELLWSEEWKQRRRAVVHSLDISEKHSLHARTIVNGFKKGIFAGNVDFYVGSINDWIQNQYLLRTGQDGSSKEPFLSHVILDLPGTHLHFEEIAPMLKPDGLLITFNPSITQLAACFKMIKTLRLPIFMEKVVELGPGISGGREWDIKLVKPRERHTQQPQNEVYADSGAKQTEQEWSGVNENEDMSDVDSEDASGESIMVPTTVSEVEEGDQPTRILESEAELEFICRPKVGIRTVGGGFVGVWRKMIV